MADIAHALHWPLGDLMDMDVDDLLAWHDQVKRIYSSGSREAV